MKVTLLGPQSTALKLTFCGDKVGQGTALVPLKLGTSDQINPIVRMEITSSTNTTKKGLTSAVIKLSMPYTAVAVDGNGGETVVPSRSGATMSIHTVINLPRSAVADLKGQNGLEARNAALRQIAMLTYMFNVVRGGANFEMAVPRGSDTTALSSLVALEIQDDATIKNIGVINPVQIDADGALSAQSASLPSLIEGGLARIVQGLSPLGCEDINEKLVEAA